MEKYKRVEAVKKAAAILDFLANEQEPADAKRIAEETGMPEGTVLSQIMTLCDAGLAERTDGGFEIGFKIAGYWTKKMKSIRRKQEALNSQYKELEG